ncbi:MAG: alpha-amylase family glycosyl hydrolase [Candidatus Amulumruptor caecigallinarius]|nr:alpha-amylase family glycosyl hydrolase [Candidatus Amulumruptor caecigallinarius]
MKNFLRSMRGMALTVLCAASATAAYAGVFIGDRKDFRDETIYFAMTTRFYDGDPTNNVCSWDKQDVQKSKNDPDWRGDFKGLIDKLDYIKALGFTAVWITPVVQNASGEDYHGYHAMDFSKVDLRYESRKSWGAEKDVKFQDLIDAAHAKGIKVVLDVVLQHTGNFGEATLNPLFTRSQNIKDQANVAACMIPNTDRLSANYFDQSPQKQYEERWKYFKQAQYEPNNYYHHYGTGWNWDEDTRWWGQIAGDCVDLNTENNAVAEYIVNCYGNFIKMGVDGFRIDTTGHIAPLTFNKQFIPQFHQIAEENRSKRLNGGDFFMFGECCQRYQGSVVYRDHPNLSSYFYTWKSDQSLLNEYNGDATWWARQVLNEGHDTPVGPMAVCVKDTKDKPTSNNVLMQNGAWHEPDYSQYSGFSVIDFPMHYSFNNAGAAVDIAKKGDNKYNDASYNVVYVDSHDYCPGPNDGTRFVGGTAQWAENLSLMFTFRGIPCIYYGSEVEFKKGKPIDVGGENNKTPRSESGRAYFGTFLEGNVSASDFGEYTASGNVAKTLNGDLAQHVRRLNQIRAKVPALRRGQYTFDGCSANGGWAFKRAYKNESYALVAINGGATFSGVPAGTYVDLVTGQSYTPSNGSITVSAPQGKGQLRVLVKDWTGGKVGEDGKFIYASSPVAHGGSVDFTDPGTTSYYTSEDAVGAASVKFSPAGSSFKTETLTVTATLSESATTGWFQVGNGSRESLNPGQSKNFTIGSGMAFGETVTVSWGADDRTGKETYRKVDPNAVITVYVTGSTQPNIYAWEGSTEFNGKWPGTKPAATVEINGAKYWCQSFPDVNESLNIVLNNNGGAKTADITGITSDIYLEWNGTSSYTVLDPQQGPGPQPPVDDTELTRTAYFDNSISNWSSVYVYAWDDNHKEGASFSGAWPGKQITEQKNINGKMHYVFSYTLPEGQQYANPMIIFNNGNGGQTGDFNWTNNGIYTSEGLNGSWSGIGNIEALEGMRVYVQGGRLVIDADNDCEVTAVRLDGTMQTLRVVGGLNYYELPKGFYIVAGRKVII